MSAPLGRSKWEHQQAKFFVNDCHAHMLASPYTGMLRALWPGCLLSLNFVFAYFFFQVARKIQTSCKLLATRRSVFWGVAHGNLIKLPLLLLLLLLLCVVVDLIKLFGCHSIYLLFVRFPHKLTLKCVCVCGRQSVLALGVAYSACQIVIKTELAKAI